MVKTSDAAPSLDELKARILAGDETVTAEELAHATEVALWEDLRKQAAAKMAAEQAEAERLDQIAQVRADILAADQADDDQADTDAITDAVARIIARHMQRAQVVGEARGRLHRLGIPAGGSPEDAHGLTWHQAGMGMPESVTIDGRRLTATAYPGAAIADAIARGAADAQINRHRLAPHLVLIADHKQPRGDQA